MPARSQAQRRWAFGVKGAAWARRHHFDTPGPLPKVSSAPRSKKTRRDIKREHMIDRFRKKTHGKSR
jgi:hypothetical protein